MIISASRRTDLPRFYFDWFLNRLHDGYVLVRNPMNPVQVSRVELTPKVVDCIAFWSKDPAPMLARPEPVIDVSRLKDVPRPEPKKRKRRKR